MKLRRTSLPLLSSVAMLGLLSAGLLAGGAGIGAIADPSLPYLQITGPGSQVVEKGFHRIRDQAAWEALWAAHVGEEHAVIAGLSTAPIIDFGRCEVVAFFRGKTINTRGERVETIIELAGEPGRRLRFDSSTYQTSSMTGKDAGVACTPFGFWIIERAAGPVVIEENTQNLKDQPPVWREQARLEIDG